MTVKKVNHRRRAKKNIEAGIAYIHSTFNNTTIIIADAYGNALAWSPAGSLGFKGSKKPTPLAAQMAAETAIKVAMEHGLKIVEVTAKGPGSGREAAARSLQATDLEVTATRDMIPVPHNGAHPPKRCRVQ